MSDSFEEYEEEVSRLWNRLLEAGVATERELGLATALDGYRLETLESVLYYFTGYWDWDSYAEEADG